jgi:hypothetical protein
MSSKSSAAPARTRGCRCPGFDNNTQNKSKKCRLGYLGSLGFQFNLVFYLVFIQFSLLFSRKILHNRITRGGVQADTTAARNFEQLTHRLVPTWPRNRFEMKARERALHVSRLSDRINQSAGKGCRKGLQERAVIGTVQIIIRALIRIYAAVGPPPQAFLDLHAGVGVRPHQALKSEYTRRSHRRSRIQLGVTGSNMMSEGRQDFSTASESSKLLPIRQRQI